MATKRTPLRRDARARVTPAAIEAFRMATETADRYTSCIRGSDCDSEDPSQHCPTCERHLDAERTLARELGLKPWHVTPTDAGLDGERPAYLAATAGWEDAMGLRRALKAALK